MKLDIINTHCPVCGYDWEKKIFNYESDRLYFSGEVTGEICPSCGREFDFNLFPNEGSYRENRINWMKSGMKYSWDNIREKFPNAPVTRPNNWNPVRQLKNIGINLLNPMIQEEYRKEIINLDEIIKQYS